MTRANALARQPRLDIAVNVKCDEGCAGQRELGDRRMAFDARRYDREVVGPLRGSHGRHLPGSLLERYAIEPDFTAEQLSQHLRTVREHWRSLAAGAKFDSKAAVGRMLLAEDEALVASVGDAMLDPQWWYRGSVTVAPPETGPMVIESPNPDGGVVEAPPQGPWREEGRAFVHQQLWQRSRSVPAVVVDDELPEAVDTETLADSGLQVDLVSADDDCLIEVTWRKPVSGDLRVRFSETPPIWSSGSVIDVVEMEGYGQPLAGVANSESDTVSLRARIPKGYHVYLPFVVTDGRALVGRMVGFAALDGVGQLRAGRVGNKAVLTWNWPADARHAQIDMVQASGTTSVEIDRPEYDRRGGAEFEMGTDAATFRVRSVLRFDGRDVLSATSELSLAGRRPSVSYSISRATFAGFSPRQVVIGAVCDEDCPPFDLVLVVAQGDIMPLTPEHGEIVARFDHIVLTGGEQQRFVVNLPRSVDRRRPYWMRCFTLTSNSVTLMDPSVSSMRIK